MNDRLSLVISAIVSIGVLAVAGFAVLMLRDHPGVVAAVLGALATVLAVIPRIIRALRSGDRR